MQTASLSSPPPAPKMPGDLDEAYVSFFNSIFDTEALLDSSSSSLSLKELMKLEDPQLSLQSSQPAEPASTLPASPPPSLASASPPFFSTISATPPSPPPAHFLPLTPPFTSTPHLSPHRSISSPSPDRSSLEAFTLAADTPSTLPHTLFDPDLLSNITFSPNANLLPPSAPLFFDVTGNTSQFSPRFSLQDTFSPSPYPPPGEPPTKKRAKRSLSHVWTTPTIDAAISPLTTPLLSLPFTSNMSTSSVTPLSSTASPDIDSAYFATSFASKQEELEWILKNELKVDWPKNTPKSKFPPELKKKIRMVKNRIAASESRRRAKMQSYQLHCVSSSLAQENQRLQQELISCQNENAQLKHTLQQFASSLDLLHAAHVTGSLGPRTTLRTFGALVLFLTLFLFLLPSAWFKTSFPVLDPSHNSGVYSTDVSPFLSNELAVVVSKHLEKLSLSPAHGVHQPLTLPASEAVEDVQEGQKIRLALEQGQSSQSAWENRRSLA